MTLCQIMQTWLKTVPWTDGFDKIWTTHCDKCPLNPIIYDLTLSDKEYCKIMFVPDETGPNVFQYAFVELVGEHVIVGGSLFGYDRLRLSTANPGFFDTLASLLKQHADRLIDAGP